MSSLAAARADNYYYPTNWTPQAGSLNQFHGSHALGKRAKDIANGVLVVRFEMPFDVWCMHCQLHIGRGVRFNAKKTKVGMYFTTILYEFRIKCTQCKQEMVIATDPEHRGYRLVRGVKKQHKLEDVVAGERERGLELELELERGRETERLDDAEVRERVASDPFFQLEHAQEDHRRATQRARGLDAIAQLQDAQFNDDYASNAALRATFRKRKHELNRNQVRAEELGLAIPLLDVHPDDVVASKTVVFQALHGKSVRKKALEKKRVAASDDDVKARHYSNEHRRTVQTKATDSFRYFGDAVGSQLNRLKKRKSIAATADARLDAQPIKTCSASTRIIGRAAPKARRDRVAAKVKRLSTERQ